MASMPCLLHSAITVVQQAPLGPDSSFGATVMCVDRPTRTTVTERPSAGQQPTTTRTTCRLPDSTGVMLATALRAMRFKVIDESGGEPPQDERQTAVAIISMRRGCCRAVTGLSSRRSSPSSRTLAVRRSNGAV